MSPLVPLTCTLYSRIPRRPRGQEITGCHFIHSHGPFVIRLILHNRGEEKKSYRSIGMHVYAVCAFIIFYIFRRIPKCGSDLTIRYVRSFSQFVDTAVYCVSVPQNRVSTNCAHTVVISFCTCSSSKTNRGFVRGWIIITIIEIIPPRLHYVGTPHPACVLRLFPCSFDDHAAAVL